ncbi:MAG: acyl-CoA reductase [Prevotellaceae bacterium]|jgi:hypothetical protein|nr:acyl-CoA reductase [Prevotellaceae bacterium]
MVHDFASLGDSISACLRGADRWPELSDAVQKSIAVNPWFTETNIHRMLTAIAEDWLDVSNLIPWLRAYAVTDTPAPVGVVMAGNIPLVGFHDFLCVLASGNSFIGKPSHNDRFLLPALAARLIDSNPRWQRRITFVDALPFDRLGAFIATGSDTTARHFAAIADAGAIPALIRHNRRSAALLTGRETTAELHALADDILAYFGLGCRNVSLLYIPEGYDFSPLAAVLAARAGIRRYAAYDHNYRYRKAILTIEGKPLIDASAVLLCNESTLHAPPAVVHFDFYKHLSDALETIDRHSELLQCVVGDTRICDKFCTFGAAQRPALHHYADGIDTMRLLNTVNRPID